MSTFMIHEYLESEITEELARPIATLACRSFPSAKSVEDRISEMLNASTGDSQEFATGRRFVIWDDDRNAIAHAKTFVRIVKVEEFQIPVLALATVCTDPDIRGQGLGVKVTMKAFEQIQQSDWPDVSLFQTPVAVFYEKLNCRTVANRFVDKLAKDPQANPWRDDTVMIYPTEYPWPDGIVDLNGPDY